MWIKIILILGWFVAYLTAVAAFYAFAHLIVSLKQMNLRNRTILSKYLNQLVQEHDYFIKKVKSNQQVSEKELNTFLSLLLITDHKVPKIINITKSINKDVLINEIRNINNSGDEIMISKKEDLCSWIEKNLKRKIKLNTKEKKIIIVSLAIYVFFPNKNLLGVDKDIHPLIKELFIESNKEKVQKTSKLPKHMKEKKLKIEKGVKE